MRTEAYARKSALKQGDRIMSAEPVGAVLLLQALHDRSCVLASPREASPTSQIPAEAAALLSSYWAITQLDRRQAADAAVILHPDGARLVVSYKLCLLLSTGAAPSPPQAVEDVERLLLDENPEVLTLEERARDEWLLGAHVVPPEVEELVGEMQPGQYARALVHARLLGLPVRCVLAVELLAVEAPVEARPQQDLYVAALHGAGVPTGPSHGQQRLQFVADLVRSWAPESVADVGCSDAKLLRQLVELEAPVRRLVGLDLSARGLRAARRHLEAALARAADASPAAELPAITLLLGGMARPDAAAACEVLTLIEVVEHLDPPDLEAIGPALLGGYAPKRLLVTTPNKEFNLNFQPPPPEWNDSSALAVPHVSTLRLRNPDHRFEWTRQEFRDWALALGHEYGYAVELHGIGGGPLDEVVPYGVWRGPGPQTQAAVFVRTEPRPERLQSAESSLPTGSMELIWSSQEASSKVEVT